MICLPTLSVISIIIAYTIVGMFGYHTYPGSFFLMISAVVVVAVQIACVTLSELSAWIIMFAMVAGLIIMGAGYKWRPEPASGDNCPPPDPCKRIPSCGCGRCRCRRTGGDCPPPSCLLK